MLEEKKKKKVSIINHHILVHIVEMICYLVFSVGLCYLFYYTADSMVKHDLDNYQSTMTSWGFENEDPLMLFKDTNILPYLEIKFIGGNFNSSEYDIFQNNGD